MRWVLLLAVAGLVVAACGSSGSNHHAPTTTLTVIEGSCANRVASSSTLSSLTSIDERTSAVTVPGTVFYGACGNTQFAVATFEASPSATGAESVAFQDHGAYPEFFERTDTSSWKLDGSAPGPPGAKNCASFTQLPATLRTIWDDCVASTATTTTTLASWCVTMMNEAFIQAQSVTMNSNGSAVVSGLALGVTCAPGTPDDVQYHDLVTGEAPESVNLIAGATITGVNLSGGSMPLQLSALADYLSQDTDGNLFQVVGPFSAATELLGRFHP